MPREVGAHAGLMTPFVMLTIGETRDEVVFTEGPGGDHLFDDREKTAAYAGYLEPMRAASVSGERAEALLCEHIDRYRRAETASAD